MIHQPKHPVSDDSSQHIGQDIIDLKITSAGNELESLHSQAGHKSRKDVPEKSPKPGKCPGACKAIRDEKQHVFHHEGVISRIDPPGGEKLQIHGTVPAAILSGEKVITSMIMRYKENTMRPAIGKASFPFRSLLAFIAFRISPMTAPAITP